MQEVAPKGTGMEQGMSWRAFRPVLGLGALVFFGSAAWAHDGPHDHPPVKAPRAHEAHGDRPARLPNGSIFVPKATQDLLGIKTVVVEPARGGATTDLAGRVVADANASARVRATRDGVVQPPEGALPYRGQKVRKGETMAVVASVLPAAEETQLRQKLIEVERDLALFLPRSEHLSVVNPSMPMGDATVMLLQEMQIQAQALSKQAELIKATLAQRLEIKSPIDGVVSNTNVRVGDRVTGMDELFEIVDGSKARVEAYAFAPVPDAIARATASAKGQSTIPLSFLGQSPALVGQARVLLFDASFEEELLPIGTVVRVMVEDGATRQGFKLPREAVQRGPGGEYVVFEQRAGETFAPRRVAVETLDDAQVLVTGGELARGMRVVVAGAVFVAQVQ